MTIRRLAVASVVLLAACATAKDATDALSKQWTGKHADAFFVRYGPPANKHVMRDGGAVYVWTTDGMIRNSSRTPYCEVQIISDSQGVIQSIFTKAETMGDWTLSACAERFR